MLKPLAAIEGSLLVLAGGAAQAQTPAAEPEKQPVPAPPRPSRPKALKRLSAFPSRRRRRSCDSNVVGPPSIDGRIDGLAASVAA
jgi:hypothetical protein